MSRVAWGQRLPEPSPKPVRGLWVANVASGSLRSPAAVRALVRQAADVGVNTLYVVVWNRGLTLYPSATMRKLGFAPCDPRYADFDLLGTALDAARQVGQRVIAWFEFGFAASYRQPDGGPLLRAKPHWAARTRAGAIAAKNGFQWMNSFHPEVQDFLLSLLREVATTYAVDGVQGDDRFPACPSSAGYDPWTTAQYAREHAGADPPREPRNEAWITWRADRLSQYMKRVHHEMKDLRRDLIVSSAPSVYPWSKQEYLQDWPAWVNAGWVDEVCPQLYRPTAAAYESELARLLREQVAAPRRPLVWPGILADTAARSECSDDALREMVAANRRAGIQGEVFFYDDSLRRRPDFFAGLYR